MPGGERSRPRSPAAGTLPAPAPTTAAVDPRRRPVRPFPSSPIAMASQSYPTSPTAPVTPTSPIGGRFGDLALLALRVFGGLMFAQHGAQKVLGWFADPQGGGFSPPVGSLPWIAGILELVGGPLIALGLFTRPIAFLLAGEMAAAYFMAHMPRGFWPIVNKGELAVLYCFVYLLLAAEGPGAYSLDATLRGRRAR